MAIKQFLLDSTNRVVSGMDNETSLMPGWVQVTDVVFAEFVAASSTMYYVDGVLSPSSYSVVAAELANQVDSLVANIYSQWTRFSQEYLLREQAATAYQTAGYTGDCSIWITSYAVAAGVSNQTATETIIGQANQLNEALVALGALRMRKYEIIGCKDLPSVQATFLDISTQINAIAAQIA
jgi:hypothetical protein